ncbi:Major facilitator superfamily domain general substrate transporter [Penicillium cf. griseofulvum]|uniref:Major facilitator superfamily domain general substrate transporter n=1 Tax=Penicillium cf. griseofulvum TaxID=2972120 RepID=A0A9W9JN68_9EURO|nr:Major facilitator superfamily domain general substrate transporter [Penicillium cf. griseofulvum]KAJ5416436.1 Major facilitator superfamily domain general substrate transporter [Penicillium cf. griseofulvum]KAJ5442227.1 Major facilitator superfamily domain general substrate transporter [Penicillium cf. griseofulvum]
MAVDTEKNSVQADSPTPSSPSTDESNEPVVTLKTWIVSSILSCGYGLSFWPVPVVSAIGSMISADMGDPTGYIWFVPAWTISITCAFLILYASETPHLHNPKLIKFPSGPNTDLLGRRWFLVLGNLVCFIGHIVVASAKSTNQVIAGLVISGFGGANCQMAAFALPELLPNKWRHIGVVIADFTVYIAVIVAPVTARYGYELGTWAWNFWGVAIFQGLSFFGLLFLYHPPKHPLGIQYKEAFKSIDYLGAFLFIGGAVPFLMGIVWAGIYSSNDAHVVAPLVIGAAVLVCFALWESFGKLKYPLTPTYVFASSWGRNFTAPVIALGVVNMFYYSSSILWPQMITVFYTNGGADWKYSVILSLPQGFAIFFGAMLLTCFGSKLRHWHWQLTGSVFVMVVFGSLLGIVTPTNKGTMIAFVFLSQAGFGWALYLSIAITQMGVEHKNLGVSGGISGCIRFAAGAVATSIYQTVFSNTLAKYTAIYVPSAAVSAGLPVSKVTDLMAVVSEGAAAMKSYSPVVVAAAEAALSQAYCKAIFVVAMVSMAFGILGIAACLCCKDVDSKMTNKIEVYLENTDFSGRNKYH